MPESLRVVTSINTEATVLSWFSYIIGCWIPAAGRASIHVTLLCLEMIVTLMGAGDKSMSGALYRVLGL